MKPSTDDLSTSSGPLPVTVRQLECLCCGRRTPHVLGERTLDAGGTVLVQWWRCTVCAEGSTVG